ncbi:MAG: metallophosphoesterase family protein [Gaiellales bacterium]
MLDFMRPRRRKGRTGRDRRFSSLPIRGTWRRAGLGLVVVALAASAVLWGFGWFDASDSTSPRVAPGEFVPSPQTSHALVWAVGDGADGDEESKALARLIARSQPDLFLYLGDVYDKGTASDFAQNYAPVYGHMARLTAPTPGNHDWPRHAEGYDPYWEQVTGKHPPSYYSFSLAGWQILSLNSEARHGRRSAQVRWLRSQVRRPGTCRLAFWHRPRYSAGTEHGDQEDMEPFWSALRGRARIVVNGHEHDMQRHEVRDGITEFVSGAGGKGLYEIDFSYAGLAFGNDTDWGALRLDLRPGRARFAFVTDAGLTLDSGTIACRRELQRENVG